MSSAKATRGDTVIVVRLAVGRQRGAIGEGLQSELDAEHGHLKGGLVLQLVRFAIDLRHN